MIKQNNKQYTECETQVNDHNKQAPAYGKLDGKSDSSLKFEYGCINYIIGKVLSVSKISIVLENNYHG